MMDDAVEHGFNLSMTIKSDKCNLLQEWRERVERNFGVRIVCDSGAMAETSVKPSSTIQWLKVFGERTSCQHAMRYIRSLCNPEVSDIFNLTPELYEQLRVGPERQNIERHSQAVLVFEPDNPNIIFVHGADVDAVGIAISLLDSFLAEVKSSISSPAKSVTSPVAGPSTYGVSNIASSLEEAHSGLAIGSSVFDSITSSSSSEVDLLRRAGLDAKYTDKEVDKLLTSLSMSPNSIKPAEFMRQLYQQRASSISYSPESDAVRCLAAVGIDESLLNSEPLDDIVATESVFCIDRTPSQLDESLSLLVNEDTRTVIMTHSKSNNKSNSASGIQSASSNFTGVTPVSNRCNWVNVRPGNPNSSIIDLTSPAMTTGHGAESIVIDESDGDGSTVTIESHIRHRKNAGESSSSATAPPPTFNLSAVPRSNNGASRISSGSIEGNAVLGNAAQGNATLGNVQGNPSKGACNVSSSSGNKKKKNKKKRKASQDLAANSQKSSDWPRSRSQDAQKLLSKGVLSGNTGAIEMGSQFNGAVGPSASGNNYKKFPNHRILSPARGASSSRFRGSSNESRGSDSDVTNQRARSPSVLTLGQERGGRNRERGRNSSTPAANRGRESVFVTDPISIDSDSRSSDCDSPARGQVSRGASAAVGFSTTSAAAPSAIGSNSAAVASAAIGSAASNLRPIIIDGSNVAMTHSHGRWFSARGIEIVVQYFRDRGHSNITAFVPQSRRRVNMGNEVSGVERMGGNRPDEIRRLEKLFEDGYVNFTPSRRIGDVTITCYDDRYVLDLAAANGGIIVSNDNYRDLQAENNSNWTDVLLKRILPYTFVGDLFMPPSDPLGRFGPKLDHFLMINPPPTQLSQYPLPRGANVYPPRYPGVMDPRAMQITPHGGPNRFRQPQNPQVAHHIPPRFGPQNRNGPTQPRFPPRFQGQNLKHNSPGRNNQMGGNVSDRGGVERNDTKGPQAQNEGGARNPRRRSRSPTTTNRLRQKLIAVFTLDNKKRIEETLEKHKYDDDIEKLCGYMVD